MTDIFPFSRRRFIQTIPLLLGAGWMLKYILRGVRAPLQQALVETPLVLQDSIPVYLGNGCFWERQYAYVNVEMECNFDPKPTRAACTPFHRPIEKVTSLVGYAGGTKAGLPCYHSGAVSYEELGHAEVTQVELDKDQAETQFKALLTDFFDSFNPRPNGMERPDPANRGPPYRSVVGIPGGAQGPLMPLIKQQNIHNMTLKAGKGFDPDVFNTVWILDSEKFPFWRAEQYHQYHSNYFGPAYPKYYLYDYWQKKMDLGHIPPTGCPEARHW
eukprot:g31912.t1